MISFNLQPTGVEENFLPFGWKTTMTCTNTRIQIRNLSNFTTDAQTSGETMLEAAKASIKLTRKVLASNLMEGLQTRRVGTHKVEKVARMITEEEERNESVVKKILDIEVELTKKKEQKARKVCRSAKRTAEKILPAGWMRLEFRRILAKEAKEEWDEGRKNRVEKCPRYPEQRS